MDTIKLLFFTSILLQSMSFGGIGCGLPQLIEKYKNWPALGKYQPAPALLAPEFASRSYETENFAIHYTLYSIHKVVTSSKDNQVLNLFDSLQTALNPSDFQDYQNIFNEMDNQNASHPEFILNLGKYAEEAYNYYVNELGMKWSETILPSRFFQKPSIPNKLHIEVVDINRADLNYAGTLIYGLAYPYWDFGGGVFMENDFRWDTTRLGEGDYLPITFEYFRGPQDMVLDYSVEWDKALKVTTMHELYHVVQYGYINQSHFANFHFWFEASATGMEDILADEVNDYYQYLPVNLDGHSTRSLTHLCRECRDQYGNGIFLHFLFFNFDSSFEKKLWGHLEKDTDIINAFNNSFADYNSSFAKAYPKYGSRLIYNQKENAPFELFNKDAINWPILKRKNLDLSSSDSSNLSLPPLSFEIYDIYGNNNSVRQKINLESGENASIMLIYGNEIIQADLNATEPSYIIPLPQDNTGENFLFISNNSPESYASFKITPFLSVKDSSVYPFPNPLVLSSNNGNLLFTKPFTPDSITNIEIYSEYGDLVQKLQLDSGNLDWSWNLKNSRGENIIPGVYFLKTETNRVQPFLIQKN